MDHDRSSYRSPRNWDRFWFYSPRHLQIRNIDLRCGLRNHRRFFYRRFVHRKRELDTESETIAFFSLPVVFETTFTLGNRVKGTIAIRSHKRTRSTKLTRSKLIISMPKSTHFVRALFPPCEEWTQGCLEQRLFMTFGCSSGNWESGGAGSVLTITCTPIDTFLRDETISSLKVFKYVCFFLFVQVHNCYKPIFLLSL